MASNTEIDWSGLPDAQAGAGTGIDFSGLPDAGDASLAGVRSPYADELNDPKTAGKLYALTHREVGSQGPEAQQAFVETVFNRAAARNMSLGQTISDPNYYPRASLRRAALSPDDVTRYQQMALNAAQGSNISGLATGNASGSVGFAGGPQTFRAGGERFGIEGPDRGWAQNFEQAQRGQPVQQQDVYTRVEKAVPVNVQEHEVARAYPVSGPRPPLPGGPDTLNAPPVPKIDWSGLPDAGAPAGVAPASIAAPEGNFPQATAVVPQNLTSIQGPQQIAPTPTGKLPEQPPVDPFAGPEPWDFNEAEAVKQFVQTPVGQQAEKAAKSVANMVKSQLELPRDPLEIITRLYGIGPYGLAQMKGIAAAFKGKPAEEVARTAIPEYNLFAQARDHEVGSQEWWDAVIPLGIEGAGFLLGAAGARGGKAPGRGMVPGEAPPAAGEAGAAAPAGEAAAAGARPKFDNVGDELRWLKKNDPAEWQRRFDEEKAKRQKGEYEVRHDTEPVSAAAPEPPPAKPAQPTAAAPEPAPEAPTTVEAAVPAAPETPAAPSPGVPAVITDELAARGHSPEHIAGLSPVQAAALVQQPAPNEPPPTQAPAFPPPSPGEQPGSAWHGVPFPSADPIKAALIGLGYEPDTIDAMTRSQLTAATPVIEAARQPTSPEATKAAPAPAIDLSGLPDQEAPAAAPGAPEPTTATLDPTHPTTNVPLSQITLSKDVPQFKSGADEKGVVEPLAGKYERVGTPPVQLWQRLNGDLELISGRHRMDLARRTGETSIPSQIHREADGFTKHQAAMLDAELNIRDEQGSIADYANYFKNSGITQAAAEARGLLGRGKGKAGFSIAQGGSESLFALHQSGRLTDSQAQAIAEAAPGNEGLQRVGIQNALAGGSGQSIANLIRGVKATLKTEPVLTQPDMLTDDTAMQAAVRAGERAGKVQREIGQRIIAVEGAARHPGKAKALGVDVGNPASVVAKAKELKALQERARHWDMDDQLRDMILKGDMSPEEIIKALSKPRPPPRDEGTEDLFNVAETPRGYGPAQEPKLEWKDASTRGIRTVETPDGKYQIRMEFVGNWRGHTGKYKEMGWAISKKNSRGTWEDTGGAYKSLSDAKGAAAARAKEYGYDHIGYTVEERNAMSAAARAAEAQPDIVSTVPPGKVRPGAAGAGAKPPETVAETPGGYGPAETYSHSYAAGDFGSERLVTVRDSKGNVIGQRDPFYPQGIPVSPKARNARIAQVAREIVQEHKAKIVSTETPAPYAPPVPAANTVKLAEDIQTFLDFNKVPPARKAQATEEIKNTLALAGDPALQRFYHGGGSWGVPGFYGVPGPLKAQALRANKNRLSIVIHDLISRDLPTWNIEGSIIANAADFAMAVGPIRSPDFESFKVVARDPVTKRVLAAEITSVGTVDQALLNPRDVFRLFARIKEKHPNAEIIVSHNHPSGKPKPSDADKNVQRRLHAGAAAAGVKLADHIITNGKEYFSFEQEEVTGNGYGTLPNPVLQPWEVVRQEESPALRSPEDLANFTVTLRADDPNAVHIFYTGTQMNLKALERVSQGTNLAALKAAVSNGIARESAYGVLLDFARVPPANVITSLVNMVHDAMGAKFVDASWPGMDSVRAAGSHGVRPLTQDETGYITEHGGTSYLQRGETGTVADVAAEAGAGGISGAPQVPQLPPLSQMERTALETLRRAKSSLTAAGKRKLARLEARLITQGDLLGSNDVFNLSGEQQVDWAARQAQADAAEAVRVAAQQAAEKAQMSLFEKPDMPYVTGTARVNESNGGGRPPYGPAGASMFSGNTPPRSNPHPIWAKRYARKMRAWWQDMLPRSYEIVRKVPESPVISEHQKLLERELAYVQNFSKQPWWQALRRRTEEEIVDLEHAAVTTYRRLLAGGTPRDAAWAQAVSQAPPDLQALFQYREGRVPTERWAAGQLAVDEPSYTGDPYIARLTNEEGKAVVDLHPQIANWGRHIRQSIGSFDKSRVHATMKEGIQNGTQYEPPTLAAFVRELYSGRLEGTARMLKRLKDEGVLFDKKADAEAAARSLKKSAGPVTLVRGFGGKDYWARSRVEAQFLAQNLNTTSGSGAVGKLVRAANAFARNPNLLYNPLPHATKNMAFKYALARIGNFTLRKSAREFGTSAQMRARFEAVMPMPSTGLRLPQLRALEAGTYLERIASKAGKWLSGNHFSARFNFAKADPALRYALWKTYLKKGMSDQAAANHVWVDLIRYDENSGALNFWRGIPFNFFATWRLGTYISLAKQLRSHPIRALLFIGAVEYLREILYRKYGWWTHLPVDYVDAPLADAIKDPKTIPGVAATTLLFGPGGGQAPHTIEDVMKTLHGDPGNVARVVNMFWGLSQLFNMPQEFNAYLKDQDPKHLALILSNAAFSTHSALKYNPHRLMQWLPEWMPGLEKSALVRRAEGLQAKIEAKTEKARATYEARHGIGPTLEYRTEEGQMRALERAAGEHPPKPGPPKRTRILPSPRSSGKPRGFGLVQPEDALDYVA